MNGLDASGSPSSSLQKGAFGFLPVVLWLHSAAGAAKPSAEPRLLLRIAMFDQTPARGRTKALAGSVKVHFGSVECLAMLSAYWEKLANPCAR